MKKRIYITGNIGTGKSTTAEIFKKNGFHIISADEVANEILKEKILLISDIFNINEKKFIDFKKKLGTVIFKNKDKKRTLENILIPLISYNINLEAKLCEVNDIKFVIESPTYFEVRNMIKGTEDIVILVISGLEKRIDRISKRNPYLTIEEIDERISSQISQEDKIPLSDFVIENNGFTDKLEEYINKLIEKEINYI